MRVVHVCKVKGIAGTEGHLLRLLPGLARRGADVWMMVLVEPGRSDGGFAAALAAVGVPVETLPIRAHVDPFVVASLRRRFTAVRPDIVHTHLVHADAHGLWAARLARVPHTVSSSHNTDPFRRRASFRFLTRWATARPEMIVAISDAVARFVTEVESAPADRVVKVNYGLEPDLPRVPRTDARARLGATDGQPLVGMMGRLVEQKGVDILLDAFPQVLAAVPAARLAVVGDGPLRASLEARAARLGIADRVRFTGWLDHAGSLMSSCELVVVPSRFEGFGLVALEAMAAGRPVVATQVDALDEVVADGETGILVPVGDAAALAGAMTRLLRAPDLAEAMGRAGRRRLETRFSVERMVEATYALYQRLLDRGPVAPEATIGRGSSS